MNKMERHTSSDEQVYIGLDIGKTKVAAGIVTRRGKVLLRTQVPTEIEKGGETIVNQCRHLIRNILDSGSFEPKGIGVGSSGVVNHEQGVIVSSGSIPGWHDIRIKDRFKQEFKVPVEVDNDVIVSALGEHFFGAGKGVNTSVFMVISTGVGFSTIKDGKVWRGAHNLAGQIAHLKVFGKGKMVNDVFSGRGISQRASGLLGRYVSTNDVFRLASEGNVEAERVVEEAIEGAASTIAWIQNTIDPDIFIVGGGVALNEESFVEKIRLRAERFLVKYRTHFEKLNVTLPKLGSDAGLVGCVALFADARNKSIYM